MPGPTITAAPLMLHLCQPSVFFSLPGWWQNCCIALQPKAWKWAKTHKIMGGLLRGSPVGRRYIYRYIFFFNIFSHHPHNLHSILFPPMQPSIFLPYLLLISRALFMSSPPSDDPQLPHANERHCCVFNANQYCANIHLRRRLPGERGAWPARYARNSMFCTEHCCGNAHAYMHALYEHPPSLKIARVDHTKKKSATVKKKTLRDSVDKSCMLLNNHSTCINNENLSGFHYISLLCEIFILQDPRKCKWKKKKKSKGCWCHRRGLSVGSIIHKST